MRWYLFHCIDCKATQAVAPQTVYCEHRVVAHRGVFGAWAQARKDGYWPLHVIESGWVEDEPR